MFSFMCADAEHGIEIPRQPYFVRRLKRRSTSVLAGSLQADACKGPLARDACELRKAALFSITFCATPTPPQY